MPTRQFELGLSEKILGRTGEVPGMDELELNRLDRFNKHSPHLVLEEHGSCEVPAGCGGMVMRWLNANREIPVLVRFYAPGPARLFLDGVEQKSTRLLIPYGHHALEIEISEIPAGSAALALIARRHLKPKWDEEQALVVATAADGLWLGQQEGDAAWLALWEMPMLPPKESWQWDSLRKTEARPVGLPGATTLRIRREFEVRP